MHDCVRQPQTEEFVGRNAVRDLVAHVETAWILIQHLEVKPDLVGYFFPKYLVAENVS